MAKTIPQPVATTTTSVSSWEQQPFNRRQQLYRELLNHSELLLKNRLQVRHLMTQELVTIPPQTTVEEMISLLLKHRLHHLLVCNRAGELIGVISDRDLHAPRGATAQQLMSSPVQTITADALLSPAITFLVNENISCLPVIENGRLCGVLTTSDLVLALQAMLQLWMRLTQVIEQDPTWVNELDKIAATLDSDLTAQQLADRTAAARRLIHQQVQSIVDAVDLRADVLTGMSNHRGLEEVLRIWLAVHRRYQQPFCLVIATIDHFNHIRQNCGDDLAKPLVRAVARLIMDSVRDSDFSAHYRADAFAIVMPQTSLTEAETFCARLRDDARQNTILGTELRISAGAMSPKPEDDIDQILARAEAAVT